MESSETCRSSDESPVGVETSEFEKDALIESKNSPGVKSDSNILTNSTTVDNNNDKTFRDPCQTDPTVVVAETGSERQNENGNLVQCEPSQTPEGPAKEDSNNFDVFQNERPVVESSVNGDVLIMCDSTSAEKDETDHSTNNEKFREVVVRTAKPLCADYQSDSDTESADSESDSSTTSSDTTEATSDSENESDDSLDLSLVQNKAVKGDKSKRDLLFIDLPPIENLKITVPEDACAEIGTITSIVDTLVVVESYKGSSALDIDTVLFLDHGKQTLGKVFDILGPVSEPIYTVRFNSQEHINALNIKKDMKVYYAPKTEHTNFVFMSEVLKNRGSDASWKDNAEAPPEFQDFSDDEEERLHKNKQGRDSEGEKPGAKEQNKSRKRPFNKVRPAPGIVQAARFRHPNFPQRQRQYLQRNPPVGQFASPPPFPRSNFPGPVQVPPFPYNGPPYARGAPLSVPPQMVFPPRPSGPPFPAFGSLPFVGQGQSFQQPVYQQQRAHAFPHGFGSWGRPVFRPPPPPPPPGQQGDRQTATEGHPWQTRE